MKNQPVIGKICLVLVTAIGCFMMFSDAAFAQAHHHAKFSMPFNHVIQDQVNAGLYTPERRQAEVLLTNALYETDPQRALALLNEAAKADPTFDKPLMYACDLLRRSGSRKQAAAACREAARRLPNYGFYEMRLGEVEEEADEPEQAAEAYERAVAIYQSNDTPDRAGTARNRAEKMRKRFKNRNREQQ